MPGVVFKKVALAIFVQGLGPGLKRGHFVHIRDIEQQPVFGHRYFACGILHQHLRARGSPISFFPWRRAEPDLAVRPPRRRCGGCSRARCCAYGKQALAGPRQHGGLRENLSGRAPGRGAFDGNGVTDAQSAPLPAASLKFERIAELYGPVGGGSRGVLGVDEKECIRIDPIDPGHNSLELHLPAAVVSRGKVALRKKR